MKVEHWVSQTQSNIGIFIDHLDISLTPQQEEWLEIYYSHIRSLSVKRSSYDVHDEGKFFLSLNGAPVVNLRLDMKRLLELFPQASETEPAVSSRRQQSSAGVSEEGDDEQPSSLYAASKRDHSPPSSSSSDGDTEEPSGSRSAYERKHKAKSTWLSFLDLFPVTVNATTPTQEDIVSAGFPSESRRYLSNKWRTVQQKQRIQYILDKCKFRNCPTEARVAHCLRAENWAVNCPHAIDVVRSWVPVKDHSKCPDLINHIQAQSWKGLCLKDFGPPKNKGVIATMPFSKGEVVCDYHGEYITQEEGNRRMQQLYDEACYIFFFAGCGEKVCFDAQTSPCRCHPNQDTFGRRMNHSRRNPNVKPHVFKLPLAEGTRWHPIFLALKDINVNEELVWDYGVLCEEFGGEAVGLDWLDS